MPVKLRLLPLLVLLFAASAMGAGDNEPHIGYIYPAGGQRGTTVTIIAGGQFLRGVKDAHVTGEGVSVKVVKFYRPTRNLDREEAQLLRSRINEVRDMRMKEMGLTPPPARKPPAQREAKKPSEPNEAPAVKAEEVKMPEHPLLEDLENKSLREIAHLNTVLFSDRSKQQQNRQLGEMVLIEITIDPNAEPGNRELRLLGGRALTNPVVFQVGRAAEVRELEPNDEGTEAAMPEIARLPRPVPIELPVTINGQILPGDEDNFSFRARRGQQLVVQVHARSLIPYLADAVPGWFQAVVVIRDEKGAEVAFADDYRFNPDPALFYQIPGEGEYVLEILAAIYRVREDFVYRVTIDEQPFISQVFPLGGRAGERVTASVQGWNLRESRLSLDTSPGGTGIRQAMYDDGKKRCGPVRYAVDTLPEFDEAESNNTIEKAQDVNVPEIVNGRIGKSGDVDVFRFSGAAGDEIVAEVCARRLNSPLDSLVRLMDEDGQVLAWNDDYVVTGEAFLYKDAEGLLTHHADSYLTARLPKDGAYLVQISDSQQHGGAAWGYRLRVSHPRPDFELRMTPSSLNMSATGTAMFYVHVMRKDGFSGQIEVRPGEAASGFRVGGGLIPAGCDRICMTLTAPPKVFDKPFEIQLEGAAGTGSQVLTHPIVASEDMMQAFLYRHLVPSQKLIVTSGGPGRGGNAMPPVELNGRVPVRIEADGVQTVKFKVPGRRPALRQMELELHEAPRGLTLEAVSWGPEGVSFQLMADKDLLATGYTGNVIVEAFHQVTPPAQKEGNASAVNRRMSMGFLPAIAVEVVKTSASAASGK